MQIKTDIILFLFQTAGAGHTTILSVLKEAKQNQIISVGLWWCSSVS
jgi:hypothetical protein